MLELGVFGGWYFGKDYDEYPSTWFKNAKISTDGFDESLNRFKITAGLTSCLLYTSPSPRDRG